MKILTTFLAVILAGLALSFIFALPVMWLWDWLMPGLFGLRTITWLEAWGLSLLCQMLFSNRVEVKRD